MSRNSKKKSEGRSQKEEEGRQAEQLKWRADPEDVKIELQGSKLLLPLSCLPLHRIPCPAVSSRPIRRPLPCFLPLLSFGFLVLDIDIHAQPISETGAITRQVKCHKHRDTLRLKNLLLIKATRYFKKGSERFRLSSSPPPIPHLILPLTRNSCIYFHFAKFLSFILSYRHVVQSLSLSPFKTCHHHLCEFKLYGGAPTTTTFNHSVQRRPPPESPPPPPPATSATLEPRATPSSGHPQHPVLVFQAGPPRDHRHLHGYYGIGSAQLSLCGGFRWSWIREQHHGRRFGTLCDERLGSWGDGLVGDVREPVVFDGRGRDPWSRRRSSAGDQLEERLW